MKEKFLFLYATLTAPKLSVSTIARIRAPQRGTVVFQHACKMGLEGMVSKRLGSRYGWDARRTGSSSRIRRPCDEAQRRIGAADVVISELTPCPSLKSLHWKVA